MALSHILQKYNNYKQLNFIRSFVNFFSATFEYSIIILLFSTILLSNPSSAQSIKNQEKYIQETINVGFKKIDAGDYKNANASFNSLLKLKPTDPYFNLLNGVAYHLDFLSGTPDSKELAEVAYQISSRESPANPLPNIQLGRLHIDNKQYEIAKNDFSTAVEKSPFNLDALNGLLLSSYLTGDLKTALWTIERIEQLDKTNTEMNKAKSTLYALLDDEEKYKKYKNLYFQSKKTFNKENEEYYERRINKLKTMINESLWLKENQQEKNSTTVNSNTSTRTKTAYNSIEVAQSDSGTSNPALSNGSSGNSSPMQPADSLSPPMVFPFDTNTNNLPVPQSQQNTTANPNTSSVKRKWFDCANPNSASSGFGQPGYGGGGYGGGYGGSIGGGGYGVTQGDETSPLQALPFPCNGQSMPQMAVIDAVMIRSEDTISRHYGINLLQGLNLYLQNNKTSTTTTTTGSSPSTTTVLTKAWGTTQSTSFLTYSLNIANIGADRNEVIARPSLVALDQMPSTFFAGATVTLGLSGNAGSVGTISDKQVGISLSITPTFIDEDSMMLAIKFARSFIQPGLAGSASSFSQQLTSSRNSVNANVYVKFGETLILSGLTEREVQRNDSGVPLLKDIPLLQYFFNVQQNSDFNRSILIMLTPRKVVSTDEDKALALMEKENKNLKGINKKTYAFHWRIEDFDKTLSKYAPNLDTVIERLQTNQLYNNFSSKDLIDDTWMSKGKLKNLLRDIQEALYH